MSRITDYVLEPNVLYTGDGFFIRVKVQDDYKYKKYLVSESMKYTTATGTTFTLTNAVSTNNASILQLQGNTTQNGTPTPTSPVEVSTVSGDNEVVVSNKNWCYLKEGNYSYSTTSTWSIEGDTITTTVNDITYQGGALNLLTGTTGRYSSNTIVDKHLTTNGGTYTITGIKEGTITKGTSGNLYTYIFIYKDNGTYRNDYILYNADTQSKTITLNSDEHIGCVSMYSQYITCENVKIKIQIEKGSTATTYIAHSGNSYRVDFGGKNLSPTEKMTTVNGGYINSSTGHLGDAILGEKYTLSFKNNSSYTNNVSVRIYHDNTYTQQTSGSLIANGKTTYTFTASVNGYVALSVKVAEDTTDIFTEIQLEKRKYSNRIFSLCI